jgi:hypothetical protein
MPIICPHCGAVLADRPAFAAHYQAVHPDEPFLEANDTPVEDEGGRSWGGTEPTDADRPLNVFEETMEETPEDTAEDLAEEAERGEPAA